jgi:hypothetical protein
LVYSIYDLIDLLLIIYSFMSSSRIFHLYWDIIITGEGLQNLGLCSALRAFEDDEIFIVPNLLWHGQSIYPRFKPNDRPIQSPLTTHKGTWRTYSIPDPHGYSIWFCYVCIVSPSGALSTEFYTTVKPCNVWIRFEK